MYAGLQTNRKSFSNLRETCHKTWQVHHCEGCCYLPVDLPTQSRRYLYRTDIFNCIMLSTPANPRPNIITDLYPAHFSKPLTPFEFLVNHASCLTKHSNGVSGLEKCAGYESVIILGLGFAGVLSIMQLNMSVR